ncbi:PREDICTED: uncharacterized protein LOC105556350 [Vollenhovia emeryi]|uniref:uncharacterized protein LOC105556350 n=1 Tax=Vollenhovia emeryi TaxID=411798 RepID=UPI0005F52921|nr:PREDICTED: uncharacterized protein LOC105556350 [Vollenhovia emeryi]
MQPSYYIDDNTIDKFVDELRNPPAERKCQENPDMNLPAKGAKLQEDPDEIQDVRIEQSKKKAVGKQKEIPFDDPEPRTSSGKTVIVTESGKTKWLLQHYTPAFVCQKCKENRQCTKFANKTYI